MTNFRLYNNNLTFLYKVLGVKIAVGVEREAGCKKALEWWSGVWCRGRVEAWSAERQKCRGGPVLSCWIGDGGCALLGGGGLN